MTRRSAATFDLQNQHLTVSGRFASSQPHAGATYRIGKERGRGRASAAEGHLRSWSCFPARTCLQRAVISFYCNEDCMCRQSQDCASLATFKRGRTQDGRVPNKRAHAPHFWFCDVAATKASVIDKCTLASSNAHFWFCAKPATVTFLVWKVFFGAPQMGHCQSPGRSCGAPETGVVKSKPVLLLQCMGSSRTCQLLPDSLRAGGISCVS